MDQKQKRQKYYLYGFLPILIVWGLISLLWNSMYGVFFLLGYTWPYMYYTPGFSEKAKSDSYRYSFLGNLFKFQAYIFSLVPENPPFWMTSLARLVVPFLISGILNIFNPSWTPLWTILGWGTFEVFVFLNKKMKWDLI